MFKFETLKDNNFLSDEKKISEVLRDVIVIGAGPAGYTASIYISQAMLNVLNLEGFIPGGQLTTTTEVYNFPGFPDGVSGPDLMHYMREQAIKRGVELKGEEVNLLEKRDNIFLVHTNLSVYKAKALIIATGASAKKIEFDNFENYWQNGVSACAICDGHLPIYRNQHIAVIGGGDTACEEAIYLSRFAKKVYVFVRKSQMRASKSMQEKLKQVSNIEVLFNSEIVELIGDDGLEQVKYINNLTKEERELNIKGLFFAIGHTPNTAFLKDFIDLDSDGYIITEGVKTSMPGVFACGDVKDRVYKQAIVAAGSGCEAALEAVKYLEN